MKESGISKTFSSLPTWAKGVIAIGAVGALFAIGLSVKNFVKRKRENSEAKGATENTQSTLRELAKRGIFPKYNDMQYKSWADRLYQLMNGYGTDEAGIYDVMKQMQNDADIAKLIEAYGVRKLSTGAYNLSPDSSANLISALSDELDSNETFIVNGILAKRGITFRF